MKLPSFQFYPGDWMKDPSLRSVSLEARGLLDGQCSVCSSRASEGATSSTLQANLTRKFPMPGELHEIALELRHEAELRANSEHLDRMCADWERQAEGE